MRTGKPVAYASIIWPFPITSPTCPGAFAVPSAPAKKTRSPGSAWEADTRGPQVRHSCWEVRGMKTPAARYAIITSPEQSNASGPVPPHRYGLPSCCCAKLMAVLTAAFGAIMASSWLVPVHDPDEPLPDPGVTPLTVKPPLE